MFLLRFLCVNLICLKQFSIITVKVSGPQWNYTQVMKTISERFYRPHTSLMVVDTLTTLVFDYPLFSPDGVILFENLDIGT